MGSTRTVQLIGGPADGAKMTVNANLKDLRVPCVIRPENDHIAGPANGFPCIALYMMERTISGYVYFSFSAIYS